MWASAMRAFSSSSGKDLLYSSICEYPAARKVSTAVWLTPSSNKTRMSCFGNEVFLGDMSGSTARMGGPVTMPEHGALWCAAQRGKALMGKGFI
ncbi:hypothetical protein D3C71_1288070 [compost metagenome]